MGFVHKRVVPFLPTFRNECCGRCSTGPGGLFNPLGCENVSRPRKPKQVKSTIHTKMCTVRPSREALCPSVLQKSQQVRCKTAVFRDTAQRCLAEDSHLRAHRPQHLVSYLGPLQVLGHTQFLPCATEPLIGLSFLPSFYRCFQILPCSCSPRCQISVS